MSLPKDIPELIEAGVISESTGNDIREYYKNKNGSSHNRLFIVFGVLGAILVGLGIILIIAHNWDELSRLTKTILAFLPLLLGQVLCGFVLLKKPDHTAWRESGTAFLFFSIGATISLVSQIYHIPGNLSSFILLWMLLSLPLIYLMKSSIASLLYLIGITYYACETSYWSYPSTESYRYWLLLLPALPHYYLLYKKKPKSNFMFFHNWLVPLSIVITLGTIAKNKDELMYIAYFSLFGLFYLIGSSHFFSQQSLRNNGYKILGITGTIVLLFTLSFDWFWKRLIRQHYQFNEILAAPEFWASIILTLLAIGFLYNYQKKKPLITLDPIGFIFLLFIPTFIIGLFLPISVVLINIYIFVIGVLTIRAGAKRNHLGILNFGLLIITALIICRFFDFDLSFIIRGVLFVLVGVGFFAANYWMLKKRRTNE